MYVGNDIPTSRKKLGWYEVNGVKYSNKYHALENCPADQHISFNFHDDLFSGVNWANDPNTDLYELYKQRAVQLRTKYDNVILYYSGGIDSHAILRTFIDNGIKIDGIIVSGSYKIDSKIQTTCNLEQKTVAQKYINELIKANKLNCPVHYLDTVDFHKKFQDENWVYNCGSNISPQIYTYNFYWQDPWIQNFLMKGKTCFIRGVDKPRVILEEGKWKCGFIDIHVLSGTPSGYLTKKQDWDVQEYFYWTPDFTDIVVKQCHVMIDWIEANMTYDQAKVFTTKHSGFNRAKYNDVADPLVYGRYITQKPGQNKNYYSLGKPSFVNLWHKDYWFIQARDTFSKEYQVWKQGLQMLKKKIPNHRFNDPTQQQKQQLRKFLDEMKLDDSIMESNILFGTVGSWSKLHYIKDAYTKTQ